MNIKTVDLVIPSNSLSSHICLNSIIELIYEKIKNIPQYDKLQRNIDLIKLICELIENLVYENNVKSNIPNFKLDLAIKVFQRLGFNKPDDVEFLQNSINFLCSNKMIKRVPLTKKIFVFLKKFVRK